MSNEFGKGAGLGFLAGWLTGRRGGRRNRISPLLFIFGGLGLFMACGMTLLLAPASFFEARRVSGYPRPTAAEIDSVAVGTAVLFQAQIPEDEAANEQGLIYAYRESRESSTSSTTNANDSTTDETSNSNSSSWERIDPVPSQIMMTTGGRSFTITLPPDIRYSNPTTVELPNDGNAELRMAGFLPSQIITINGTWQGSDTFIAETLHAGIPENYQATLNQLPGQMLLFGVICGSISLLLFGFAIVLRVTGN